MSTCAWPIYRDGILELVQTSHQQLAVRAAQAGNWKPADGLELDRLRREVFPLDAHGVPCVFPMLKPIEILRGAGPAGEDCVRWTFELECEQCEGEGTVESDDEECDGCVTELCSRCEGTGLDREEHGELVTNLQGLVLKECRRS